ncbi:iron uptake transporter deferrochelatase/peroxidase subunit [Paenibacillus sp. MBLB4367]|uniref:iron uptake transporter deferrochelatase/peroxidase subunit n=1 Tax=Paenibacillus sp. MBLB4367 TaxID=3384767 RepID=UPI00390828E8
MEERNKHEPQESVSLEAEPKPKQGLSRREMLKIAGIGGVGLLLGSVGAGGVLAGTGMLDGSRESSASPGTAGTQDSIPFYGAQQAGIVTPSQDFLCFASFDLTTNQVSEVIELLRTWTEAAARLSEGRPVGSESKNANLPPTDTGEAAGLHPGRLTLTFGAGASLFDGRFGLASKRPPALIDLPRFAGDNLREEWCGGDIGVQVCANDLQTAFHAVRNLARLARGVAVLRWTQEGFQRTAGSSQGTETPRNLLGFKDGTGNPDTADAETMKKVVWAQAADGPAWMNNGSYMVTRRIRMRIEVWDRSSLNDQQATFGRYRDTGAPLGMGNEFDPIPLDRKSEKDAPVIPDNSHIRLAHGDGSVKILRRSYSYSSGIDHQTGQLDAGLFFIAYQRDPRTQFVPMQDRLAKQDKLNEYIVHVGSAVFACFPGVREGGYIGEGLFV